MKALLDEMIPPAVAVELRRRGHDVVAVAERADLRSLPDRRLLAWAQAEERVVVTRDCADYLQLDREERAAGRTHAGLILIAPRMTATGVGRMVGAVEAVLADEEPYPGFVHWL